MKIEILITESINEECTGMVCFHAPSHIVKAISRCKPIQGIVTIDGVIAKFSYSPYFHDGDIFCEDENVRSLVKSLIPIYVYANREPKYALPA